MTMLHPLLTVPPVDVPYSTPLATLPLKLPTPPLVPHMASQLVTGVTRLMACVDQMS